MSIHTIKFHVEATTNINGWDVDWERELTVEFSHTPGERATLTDPGYEPYIEVISIETDGPNGVEDFAPFIKDDDFERLTDACWEHVRETAGVA